MTLTIQNVDWNKAKHKLSKLRERVFVCEWRIPKEYEFDQQDDSALHVLVLDEALEEIATGRLTKEGEIGRIAVVPPYRKPEVYGKLFSALIEKAKMLGLAEVSVQCELEGVELYRQQGMKPVGSVYMDAGIPRQKMTCSVSDFHITRVELTH